MNNIFKTVSTSLASFAPRTRFNLSKHHLTSVNAGRLYPIWIEEVLPGDTWQMDLHSLVRMQTPIAPIMDDIFGDYYFFFVPYRLLDEKFEKVITISDWSGSISDSLETITTDNHFFILPWSLGHYLGLPLGDYSSNYKNSLITAPGKAYTLIWNEYFRDQNYQTKVSFNKSHNWTNVSSIDNWLNPSNPVITYSGVCAPVNERHDLFTSVLPSPQKGDSVLLPLGDTAPVNFSGSSSVVFNGESAVVSPSNLLYTQSGASANGVLSTSNGVVNTTLSLPDATVDLTQATSATINQLREAIVMQHFLETLARTGSRYTEYLKGFWGVNAPDARLQRPEFIAEWHTNINVSEVIQTAGLDEASGTTLGSTGAVSRTGTSANGLFTYSSPEHGFIIGLFVVRHKLSYSQGISNMWFRKKGTDFYNPVFNGLGETPVFKRNVLAPVGYNSNFMKADFENAGADVSFDDILGFNESWAEYKFRYNQTSALLNPVNKEGLDYWTLTKAFTGRTITGGDVRLASDQTLDRALSIPGQDQFICDFYFDVKCTRRMPLRSTPGVDRI